MAEILVVGAGPVGLTLAITGESIDSISPCTSANRASRKNNIT